MSEDDRANVIGRLVIDHKGRQDTFNAITAKLKQTGLALYPITEGLRSIDPMRARDVERAFGNSQWLTASLPEILANVKEYIQLIQQLEDDEKTLKQFGL